MASNPALRRKYPQPRITSVLGMAAVLVALVLSWLVLTVFVASFWRATTVLVIYTLVILWCWREAKWTRNDHPKNDSKDPNTPGRRRDLALAPIVGLIAIFVLGPLLVQLYNIVNNANGHGWLWLGMFFLGLIALLLTIWGLVSLASLLASGAPRRRLTAYLIFALLGAWLGSVLLLF